jgi:CRP-like cAMP-binding protein
VLFFKALPDEALEDIARAGREIRLAKGEMLFAENERCRGLIVVLAGAVKVFKLDDRTVVFTMPKAEFAVLLDRYPQIVKEALKALSIRMRRLVRMVEVQALYSVQARIAAYRLQAAAGRGSFALDETNK